MVAETENKRQLPEPTSKRVVVVGPGAMGLLWGLKLQSAGHDVTFVDYRPARARLFMENGVTLISGKKRETFQVRVVLPDFPFDRTDYIFISVKSYAAGKAIEPLRPCIAADTTVISLQNGLDHIDPLSEAASSQRLIVGVTSVGANCPEDGSVVHAGDGPTLLGTLNETAARRIPDAVGLLSSAGFHVEAADNLMARLWEKLMINAAINPLTALHDVKNGKVAADAKLRETALEILDEAIKVARADEVELDFKVMSKKIFDVAKKTGDNVSSMLQDIRAGRRTEIEAINGAIVRRARKRHIKCPANEKVLADVLDLSRPKVMEDTDR